MAPYEIRLAWRNQDARSVDDCFDLVRSSISAQRMRLFHGASRDYRRIISTLDVWAEENPGKDAIAAERRFLDSFVRDAWQHMGDDSRTVIQRAHDKWRTRCNTGTMFVGRHYGLPVRCVDWTRDPRIGLFFACRRDFDKAGVVWWMDNSEFEECVASQWPRVFGIADHVEDNIEAAFIRGEMQEWITGLHYPEIMSRPTAQKACVTIAGRVGIRHDERISSLGLRTCGRVEIPADLKRNVLQQLDELGINEHSLALISSPVDDVARDVTDSL